MSLNEKEAISCALAADIQQPYQCHSHVKISEINVNAALGKMLYLISLKSWAQMQDLLANGFELQTYVFLPFSCALFFLFRKR